MDGRTDGQEERRNTCIDVRTDGWRDGRTDRQLNGGADGCKGRQVDN